MALFGFVSLFHDPGRSNQNANKWSWNHPKRGKVWDFSGVTMRGNLLGTKKILPGGFQRFFLLAPIFLGKPFFTIIFFRRGWGTNHQLVIVGFDEFPSFWFSNPSRLEYFGTAKLKPWSLFSAILGCVETPRIHIDIGYVYPYSSLGSFNATWMTVTCLWRASFLEDPWDWKMVFAHSSDGGKKNLVL